MIFSRLALLLFFAQTAPASIHGTVVKSNDGTPLSKAIVELRAAEGNAATDYTTTTSSDGQFTFPDLPPGRYRLTASRAGFARRQYRSVITVGSGQQITDIRLTLVATGAIFGRVFDSNGKPVGNTTVTAFTAVYRDGKRTLKVEQTGVTNDLGEYRLFWLTPRAYFIGAKPHSGEHVPGTQLTSGAGPEDTTGLMIGFLNAPALPNFPVSDSISSILKKAEGGNEAERAFMTTYFPGTTDQDQASAVDVRPGSEIGAVDLTITAVPTHHIRGIIMNGVTGRPAPGAQLRKARVSEIEVCAARGINREQRENCSFEPVDYDKGTFDIAMVTPGSYELYSTSGNLIAKTTIEVAGADIDDVVLTLRPGITISGYIVPPAANITVTLSPGPPLPDAEPLAGTSLSDGTFSIHGLSAGDYAINVGLKDGYIQSIKMGADEVLSALHVREDRNGQIDIRIATDGGVVEGFAFNARGESTPDAAATLIPVALQRRPDLYRTAQTDASGQYRFSNVAPGEYKLFSWEEIEVGALQNPDFMRTYDQQGIVLHVGEESRVKINSTVIPSSAYPQ
jgi:hypothetical protein